MTIFREKISWQNPFYTVQEEIANSVTHGIGTGLAVAGLAILVVLAVIFGDTRRVVSFSIYGGSLIVLYLASTLYHSVQHLKAKKVLRVFDHASIYVLIAGTYTPFLIVSIRGTLGWTLLVVVWALAIIGVAWKIFFIGRYEAVATAAYVLMGWMCLVAFRAMIANVPPAGLVMLILGGVVYTAGVAFYAWEKLPYNHAIWHLFVLGGSILHYFAIVTLLPT